MSATTRLNDPATPADRSMPVSHTASRGAVAGMIASLPMAMVAMIASYAKDTGFVTPLYHIASLLTGEADMMTSMMAAQAEGDAFTLLLGSALVGVIIHLITGAMYGVLFALLAARLRLHGAALAGAGVAYGFAVFVFSAFVGLPLAAAATGAGEPIRNMAEMAGWGVFAFEHLLFGLVLALLVGARAGAASDKTTATH